MKLRASAKNKEHLFFCPPPPHLFPFFSPQMCPFVWLLACLIYPPGKGKEASAMQANWLSKGGLKAYPIAPSFWWKQIWFFIILHLVSWTEKGFWKIKCQFLLIKNSNQIFFRCANILALDHHILFLHIRIQWWSVHFFDNWSNLNDSIKTKGLLSVPNCQFLC